jgi:hypothetical protein
MALTVSECLTNAMDSVNLINSINTDASAEPTVAYLDQAEINEVVQRNVDHLEIILAYEPVNEDDDTPDIVGSPDDKTPYTDAISTGQTYISNNS